MELTLWCKNLNGITIKLRDKHTDNWIEKFWSIKLFKTKYPKQMFTQSNVDFKVENFSKQKLKHFLVWTFNSIVKLQLILMEKLFSGFLVEYFLSSGVYFNQWNSYSFFANPMTICIRLNQWDSHNNVCEFINEKHDYFINKIRTKQNKWKFLKVLLLFWS